MFEFIFSVNNHNSLRDLRYIGLDISWKMLKTFTNKINMLNYKGNSSLILGDIEYLPFREEAFDLIFSITSLQNLQSLKKGLNELIRVGKKNTILKLSILKKQLKLQEVKTYLNSYVINLKTEILEGLEDIIIQGNLNKE